MQGDTEVQDASEDTIIYNVWDDDLTIDEWTYDPLEAIELRLVAQMERPGPIHVTRYEEIAGTVNTTDNYVRVSDDDLHAHAAIILPFPP